MVGIGGFGETALPFPSDTLGIAVSFSKRNGSFS
jgi:hypothetical protein